MKSINRVALLGFLGDTPVLRESKNGTSYTFLSIATTKAVKVDDEWQDETEWNNVSVWGSAAEFICEYGVRGSQVYFEGRVQTKALDEPDDDGNTVYKTFIGGRHIMITRQPKDHESNKPKKAKEQDKKTNKSAKSKKQQPYDEPPDFIEDDMPF